MLLLPAGVLVSQELEPRAYRALPTGLDFLAVSYQFSSGNVVFDATSPVENLEIDSHMAGLGYLLYRSIGPASSASDPMLAQGANYLNALVGIAMYVIPIGFLALLVQSVWAHPPALGRPNQAIARIRSRGKE